MTSERKTLVVVALMLLGAAGIGVAAGAVMGWDPRPARSTRAPLGGTARPSPTVTPAGPPAPNGVGGSPSPTPAGHTVPVYVLGPTAAGPRLYREFRPPTGTEPVQAAVTGLAVAPADPDYRSPWLGVSGRVTRAGTTATVTFARAPALAGATAQLAAQQVVYTVTAADPRIRTVRVVAPGLPAAGAVGRAGQAAVLAPVWLLAPADGGTAGSRLTVSGTASVFEATLGVEVRSGTRVLARTTATASTGAPGRGTWSATLSVPPGSYVVAAYELSEKDGGTVAMDTKRVTVSGR
jgi:Immunoglobulin-like domain of bacterial spore germination/Sporulation and spore germination